MNNISYKIENNHLVIFLRGEDGLKDHQVQLSIKNEDEIASVIQSIQTDEYGLSVSLKEKVVKELREKAKEKK